jgi:hypothetical protein
MTTYEDIKGPYTRRTNGNGRDKGFTLFRMSAVEFNTAPRCIVEDLIPRDGLILVWGPPKCGKTFWTFDMVAHVALGRPYGERQVEQGPVVYIAAEGEHGIRTRTVAFRQERVAEGEDPPFFLMTTALDLVTEIDLLIAAIEAQLRATENGCEIIVIDTLNRTIHGSETRDEDMSAYVQAADRLREVFHCSVVIIHHCGLSGDRPRGHTSLTGAVDAQISVQKDADGSVLATLELMKDGPEGAMMRCRLVPVEVGTDDRGNPITSCVVELLDAPMSGERAQKEKQLPAAQKRALHLLHDAIVTAGEVPPDSVHIPANTQCVRDDLWRRYCYEGGISTGDQDAKQKAFKRASETLIAAGRVGFWSGWVWPT